MKNENEFHVQIVLKLCCGDLQDLYDAGVIVIDGHNFVFESVDGNMDVQIEYCPFCGKHIILDIRA